VIYGDGSVLDVDQFTTVDLLSDELVRLLEGRIRVTIAGVDGARSRRLSRRHRRRAPCLIDAAGEYRISLVGAGGRRDVELVTIRGYARLLNELGRDRGAGGRACAGDGRHGAFLPAGLQLGLVGRLRSAGPRTASTSAPGTVSARYLPEEIHGYAGAFDRYGDWRHDPAYGYVWYPRVHRQPGGRTITGAWRLLRTLGLDVDRVRPVVGLADASLRPLGLQRGRLVLDPDAPLGACARVLGDGAGLRRLGSARLARPSGAQHHQRQCPPPRATIPWRAWTVRATLGLRIPRGDVRQSRGGARLR
jgi:hypothetical protein